LGQFFSGGSFCLWAGQLFGFGFLQLNFQLKKKTKPMCCIAGGTKSMTEKIAEGNARGKGKKDRKNAAKCLLIL